MNTAPIGSEHVCVAEDEFVLEMRKIFGDPIGSSASSKVLSEDRCQACFEYLMKLEEKEQAYNEYKAANARLKENGLKMGEDIESVSSVPRLEQSIGGVPEEVKRDILLRAAAYSAYTAVVEKLKENDDKKDQAGAKIQGRWGRYIKDAVGRGKSRRLFLQRQPAPEGLPPKYTLVASKGGLGARMLEVVSPSRWYEVLLRVHALMNHAGRDKIFSAVKEQYWNVPKFAIDRFSKLCQARQQRNFHQSSTASPKLEKSVTTEGFSSRLQVIVFSVASLANGSSYKSVCCIKDVSTQFVQLWGLKTADGEKAAEHVLSFMLRFGGAHILHLQNGSVFENDLMNTLAKLWDIPLVVGKDLSSELDPTVHLIREILRQWFMDKSRTEEEKITWYTQLDRIAYAVNCTMNQRLGKTPHESVFKCKPRMDPVYPGLTHSVVRETFKRSFAHEEELDPETRAVPLSQRFAGSSDLTHLERPAKLSKREPDAIRPPRKLAFLASVLPSPSPQRNGLDVRGEPRNLDQSSKSAVEELAGKRNSKGDSSRAGDIMGSIMKA
uniref:Integrase catalytic domain-containing protein n=1 Tax=Rhodosorus marinus TaxID=101924 RepID=A0A7S0BK18_9RHOD|mmetsp:Transcript_19461/g.28258  ORF Transcript_19461/g.28258 Transcript_19461/m.28258 type:complete len:552 (+) Transcript_19461:166-1821(+)